MKQLLSKWAELAPDECKVKDLFGVDRWSLMGMGANYESPFEGTVILSTIQAIESRGWRIRISSLRNERAGFYGCIVTDSEQKTLGGSRDDRPAYAALEAYIQALAEVS